MLEVGFDMGGALLAEIYDDIETWYSPFLGLSGHPRMCRYRLLVVAKRFSPQYPHKWAIVEDTVSSQMKSLSENIQHEMRTSLARMSKHVLSETTRP